jgi:hypothetical protein
MRFIKELSAEKIGGNLDGHGNCSSKKRSERGGEKRLMFRFLHYPFQTVFYLRRLPQLIAIS